VWFAPLDDPCTIVELGCGSGTKLATVAQACGGAARRAGALIDISATALRALRSHLRLFPARVDRRPSRNLHRRASARGGGATRHHVRPLPRSNIGNLDTPAAAEFLRDVRSCLPQR